MAILFSLAETRGVDDDELMDALGMSTSSWGLARIHAGWL